MPPVCIVATCPHRRVKNQPPKLRFHRVPNDEPRRSSWLELTGQQNVSVENLPKTMFVCEDHFDAKAYRMAIMGPVSKKLRDDAVPSLQLPKDADDGPSKRRVVLAPKQVQLSQHSPLLRHPPVCSLQTPPQMPASPVLQENAIPSSPRMFVVVPRKLEYRSPTSMTKTKPVVVHRSTYTQTDVAAKALQERGCQTEPWELPVERNATVNTSCTTAPTPANSNTGSQPAETDDDDDEDDDDYSPSQEESSSG
ncbi:uncharacterized protein LOC135375645 [Ornithodoros turicata]|uniref:uncharacterized protein LOC135375645 n=1 Tax=Ornithodoros turicata TaxID=34597 RepID=UPI0031388D96